MKRTIVKPDNDTLVREFLAKGGKLTRFKVRRTRIPGVTINATEIDIEALPKEFHRFLKIG